MEDQQGLDAVWDDFAELLQQTAPDFLRLEREHASDILHVALAYELAIRRGLTPERATEHARKFDPKGLYLSPENLDHFWIGAGGRLDSSLHNSARSRAETDRFLGELRPTRRGRPREDVAAWLESALRARDALRRKGKRVTQRAIAEHADVALSERNLQKWLKRSGLTWQEFLQLPSQ